MNLTLTLIVLHLCLTNIIALKILIAYPLAVKSINMLGEGQVKLLLNAGHELSVRRDVALCRYMWHVLRGHTYHPEVLAALRLCAPDEAATRRRKAPTFSVPSSQTYTRIDYIMEHGVFTHDALYFQEAGYVTAELALQNRKVLELLNDTNEHFDVVIADLYECEVYSGLSALYGSPLIWSYSMGVHWLVTRLLDEPTNPAYSVDYRSINYPPLSFVQRVEELWARIMWMYFKTFYTMPKERTLYKQVFEPLFKLRGKQLPDYDELIYNASMIFANTYSVNGDVVSTPQNLKLLGGFHIGALMEPMSKDMQSLMDNSKEGVIYFSMGTNWKSQYIPKEMIEGILRVFGEFKKTVIWKYEADLVGVPKNVHIVKWAPQRSILAHPNTKLFISHGGQLSSNEAVHFGLPVVGIPIAFEQLVNINTAVKTGYALSITLDRNLVENLKASIAEVLNNPSYSLRAKEVSAIYHDRPITLASELVYWVEHVVRTRGALHLRSPALMVPWYQKYYLDLAALIIILVGTIVVVIKRKYAYFRRRISQKNDDGKEKIN